MSKNSNCLNTVNTQIEILIDFIHLLGMGDPPQDNLDNTRTAHVSPLTQYSINVDEHSPSVPFFEAHIAAIAANSSNDEVILSEQDFTVWQVSNPPSETSQGLLLTPP